MNSKYIKSLALAGLVGFGLTSCEDFLDRPTKDTDTSSTFYQTDDQCYSGVNYLYNMPWFDVLRGYFQVEVLAGNLYMGDSPYLKFMVDGDAEDNVNMSNSLWAVVANTNTVYDNIKNSPASAAAKNDCMGQCLIWKAMAYFYLVRSFGDVPLVHDNSALLAEGTYNELSKVNKSDVYEYIIMTLEKAMELLPKSSAPGRIDYYCAEGLLSKVYLTKAGVSGSLNTDDLAKAAAYSKDVIDNSGRTLMQNYEDIFRGSNNNSPESLLAWRWDVGSHWTSQNSLQSDLGMDGICEVGSVWGGYNGPSVDLMEAFGIVKIDGVGADSKIVEYQSPNNRADIDTRRKATMMLPGDKYSYFWRDKGGLDYLKFLYDKDYNISAKGQLQSSSGCNTVKHIYGNTADHVAEMGISDGRMASALATHILRLADVYLVHAEAMTLMDRGTDPSALAAFNAVHQRAIPTAPAATSLTFDMIWKERRLEFACEGDRWYDYVRRSYYDVQSCIDELKSQHRNALWGCDGVYKAYYESNGTVWDIENSDIQYNSGDPVPNVTVNSFQLPFPIEDVALNPNVASDAPSIHVDVREVYSY